MTVGTTSGASISIETGGAEGCGVRSLCISVLLDAGRPPATKAVRSSFDPMEVDTLRIAWTNPTSPPAASGVRARLFSDRAEGASGVNSSLKDRCPLSQRLSPDESVNGSSPSDDEAGGRVAHRTVYEIADSPRKQ